MRSKLKATIQKGFLYEIYYLKPKYFKGKSSGAV